MNITLYNINSELDLLLDQVDTETGEIPEELADKIEKLFTDKMIKVSNIVSVYKSLQGFQDAVDWEIKKLTAKRKAVKTKAEWLKSYLQSNLNGEKINTPSFTISYRQSEAIEVEEVDLEELYGRGSDCVIKKTVYQADKIKAKEIYKTSGVLPEGFRLIRKNNIQIK